jgi:hypothetical protein
MRTAAAAAAAAVQEGMCTRYKKVCTAMVPQDGARTYASHPAASYSKNMHRHGAAGWGTHVRFPSCGIIQSYSIHIEFLAPREFNTMRETLDLVRRLVVGTSLHKPPLHIPAA